MFPILVGFDPWNESSKGLADLLNQEGVMHKPAMYPASFNPGLLGTQLLNPSSNFTPFGGGRAAFSQPTQQAASSQPVSDIN